MDWQYPQLLLLLLPVTAILFWTAARGSHPMGRPRHRLLLGVRTTLAALVILALASPALVERGTRQSLVFVLDHSLSLGEEGWNRVTSASREIRDRVAPGVRIGAVAVGRDSVLLAAPEARTEVPEENPERLPDAAGTNLARGLALAAALFPSGASRHIVLISDGEETEGDVEQAARQAAVQGIRIHTLPVAGDLRPDVRLARLHPSQTTLNEGATVDLEATIQSSFEGTGVLRLFENGIEVDRRDLLVGVGEATSVTFTRSPAKRDIYHYRAVLEGFGPRDSLLENNEALAVVDVRGEPLLLYVEGEPSEARFLVRAMEKEGIRLDVRPPAGIPDEAHEIAGYDAIIFSDVAAHLVGEARMTAIREYVEKLGGGFVMIGGPNSFGVGGYHRTPVEEMLPVKLRGADQEEHQSAALALVIDRSGSMAGEKLEICKSASTATAGLLEDQDYIGIYGFDSSVHPVLPMTRISAAGDIAGRLSALSSGGGTNAFPAMSLAREELNAVKAKVKHMIVLTDGQTSGQGYTTLATQCQGEGITISTVAVGSGAHISLLQAIAAAGGGKSYVTMDPSAITRIFTQDTLMHTDRLIREDPFQPKLAEDHPMLRGWRPEAAPPLLGYVRTRPKPIAQIPLLTATGDPLLAHWHFGAGKVTTFSSDCKSRWAALWIDGWDGYARLWSQVLRETARPPQNRNMDLRLSERGDEVVVAVDLLADAGTRRNNAEVGAEVHFVPANSLGAGLKQVPVPPFEQRGPGLYEASFRPDEAGAYLVRARAGTWQLSASHIHQPTSEVAAGQADEEKLRRVAELSGGQFLSSAASPLLLEGSGVTRHIELWPYLLVTFVGLFLVDVLVRRWENVLGVAEAFVQGFVPAKPRRRPARGER